MCASLRVGAHACLSEEFGVVNKKSIVPFKHSASDFISLFPPSALHRDKWLCHSGVSAERGRAFVVNVSACGFAGRWVLGVCEIPSLTNSTLASTPGHRVGSRYKSTAIAHTQIHTLTVQCKAAIRKGKKAHSHFPYSKTKNPESCEPNWRQLPRSRLSGNSTIIAMLHLVSVLVCPCCFIKTISSSRLLELTMDVLFVPHRSVSICVYLCVCVCLLVCVCETMSPQGSHKCSPSSCCVYVSVSLHSSVSDCAQPSTVAQN